MPPLSDQMQAKYDALRSGAVLARAANRAQLAVTGKDRATFLHGFCTNDIKRLAVGEGCEAFLTNVQGRTVGLVNVFCDPGRLVLETVAGQVEPMIGGLDRYIIREDVQLVDHSQDWSLLRVAGPQAAALLKRSFAMEAALQPWQHATCEWDGQPLVIRRVDACGSPEFLVGFESSAADRGWQALVDAGAVACDSSVLEVGRIEMGTPVFGIDITDDNLPQEVDRNATAISFTKGCYLGQETVARIDALGHVNRLLRGLRLDSQEVPPTGTEFFRDGNVVARTTSACWSPHLNGPLALAYVRRELAETGERLEGATGHADVVTLPLA